MRQRHFVCLAFAVLALLIAPSRASAQKLVFVVRHAERADGGAGTSTSTTDPLLSAVGEARAGRLAGMLADAGIQAIFATEFKRTQDTVKPLAAKLGLAVQSHASSDTAGLLAQIKATHAGDVVLVAGHSNTLPAIIKGFGGPDVTIGDAEYDNLFIIVPASGTMTRLRF